MKATSTRLALGALLLWPGPAFGSEPQGASHEPQPGWEFSFAPYVWGAGLEGTVDADDISADVDVSFSDILDDLDAGVLGSFEARRERFSLTTNLVYLKLSPEAEQPIGAPLPGAPPGSFEVRSTMETLIFEVRPTYEVLSLPLFGETEPQRISLDLGPGARRELCLQRVQRYQAFWELPFSASVDSI